VISSTVGRIGLAVAVAVALAGADARAAQAASTVTVHLSLDRFSKVTHVSAGDSVGVSPALITVHVGDSVVFVNDDASTSHTATGLPGASRFGEPRWTQGVLKPSGSISAEPWSSGELAPGARSSPIAVTTAGTILYGCFFHYSAGMRGEIIVEP
jgi:plastocyanin